LPQPGTSLLRWPGQGNGKFHRLDRMTVEVQSRKMKPIFSVHAGEYLTGSYIEKRFRHVNLWVPAMSVTKSERCWETRDLSKDDKLRIASDNVSDSNRDFTKYLNTWQPIQPLNELRGSPTPRRQ
jgi:hypothetical protein